LICDILDAIPIRILKTDSVTRSSQDAEGSIPSSAGHISVLPCFHDYLNSNLLTRKCC